MIKNNKNTKIDFDLFQVTNVSLKSSNSSEISKKFVCTKAMNVLPIFLTK